ncbi:MAG TPA: copper amine oxidase N-terminal domain-containing protein [Thermoanaerobacterales bacterium]|nr:copper amine oxidase N-terminal domain-containing protein [Thermoanaerobacterales bacterium]
MRGKHFAVLAVIISFVLIFSSSVQASSGMKNIKAYFNNIKVIVNGKQQASTPEPFIYDNTTYVPIRLVSTGLGANVYWDSNQKAVVITSNAQQNQALQQQIADLKNQLSQKDAELVQLRQQNAYLGVRIGELESTIKNLEEEKQKDPAKELEDYLYDKYSRWERMDFDYDVDGDEDDLELTIEIDLSDYGTRWDSTDQNDIEDWLNDIYDYVQDEYPNADFSGTIVDTDEDETLVEFEASGSNLDVNFKHSSEDFDDLEDDLNDMYGQNLDDYNSDFGDMTADISVEGDENDEEIYITIIVDTSEYGDEWDNVKETDDAEEWIEDIVDYTLDMFEDYDVSGEIINQDGDTMADFDVSSSGNVYFDWDYTY